MTDIPVPMRVRHVAVGDVFVSARDGSRWRITSAGDVLWRIGGRELRAEHDGQGAMAEALDPDHVLHVLIPADEYDAVELCRELLGAQLIGRRSVDRRTT